ncbi:MAG: PAS domain-containing protein, partial [Methanobacteriota archaeon]
MMYHSRYPQVRAMPAPFQPLTRSNPQSHCETERGGTFSNPDHEGEPALVRMAPGNGIPADQGVHDHIVTQLKEDEERCYHLFKNDPTGCFLAAIDGTILTCNQAFLDMFGFATLEEAIATNSSSLY